MIPNKDTIVGTVNDSEKIKTRMGATTMAPMPKMTAKTAKTTLTTPPNTAKTRESPGTAKIANKMINHLFVFFSLILFPFTSTSSKYSLSANISKAALEFQGIRYVIESTASVNNSS